MPSVISHYDNVISLSIGLEYSYGLQLDGTISIWQGLLTSPTQFQFATESVDAVVVAGGGAGTPSACAVVRDGTVRCWGINSSGQLGDGTNTSTSPNAGIWPVTTVKGLRLW